MVLKDAYDFSIIENKALDLILQEMENQLDEDLLKDNEEFILDIAAYALNHVPPKYSYTLLGKLYTENLENENYYILVKKAVAEAVKKISRNPAE